MLNQRVASLTLPPSTRCSSGDRYRVQLFLNEKLLPLQEWGCDRESCSWTQFMGKFGRVLTDCKQRRLCWGL